jgi:tight adherence protein B
MRRRLLALATCTLAIAAITAGPAVADDSALQISHVEPADGEVRILLSVPTEAQANLDGITVTLNGEDADAESALAGEGRLVVRRTTILAIDTSDSMAGNGRFAAAKSAATTFLDTVPADVFVGIVTFDATVDAPLQPTTDREAAKSVIDGLELARGTFLNDGVIRAVEVAGSEGQRSILVLSDGLDISTTPIANVEAAIADADVKVDVVALDQSGGDLTPLRAMSTAGGGEVIPANPEALTAAFSAEAELLARQFLVTAQIPDAVSADEATVRVTVPSSGTSLTAHTFAIISESGAEVPDILRPADEGGLQIPREAMYGGLAAIGLGLLILVGGLMWMATAGSGPRTVEERIASYAGGAPGATGGRQPEASAFNLDQAKDAAASMLQRSKGLEARIEARLEAAGSALKSSEWLLMHAAIAIVAGLVGLLAGGGSFALMVLFVAGGVAVPWMWLGHKRRKRVKAFNAALGDTLQLVSGSLTAGMSLAQSIDTVVNEGTEPIAGEFKRVLVETRLGVPLNNALEGVAARMGSKDFAWVVLAIKIQRDVGGNLAELLTTVAATLRERDYLRRQVRTLSAEGRISAYILGGLPPVMAIYMLLVRPSYIRVLYTDPRGWLMIAAALALLGFAAFLMSRLVKVEV